MELLEGDDVADCLALFQFGVYLVDVLLGDGGGDEIIEVELSLQVHFGVERDVELEVVGTHTDAFYRLLRLLRLLRSRQAAIQRRGRQYQCIGWWCIRRCLLNRLRGPGPTA